mmetsp:Transcript_82610/g.130149  ORF Transcript_82610/g.130149 Transcript_82610/m.130149 type:complete len:84 (+) Transcript_82610:27-278(+)
MTSPIQPKRSQGANALVVLQFPLQDHQLRLLQSQERTIAQDTGYFACFDMLSETYRVWAMVGLPASQNQRLICVANLQVFAEI